MAWFGRKKSKANEVAESVAEETPEVTDAPPTGPFDIAQVDDLEGYLDLGVIKILTQPEMNIRIELDSATRAPLAVSVGLGDSVMQLQAYAAPKSAGIWKDLRAERVESAEAQNGEAIEQHGPFGSEVVMKLPVQTPAGSGIRPLRCVGIDGPRWFLQALFIGPAATDMKAAVPLEEALRGVVVDRGDEPLPPKRIIALTIPGQAQAEPGTPSFTMPSRGPEITEIR